MFESLVWLQNVQLRKQWGIYDVKVLVILVETYFFKHSQFEYLFTFQGRSKRVKQNKYNLMLTEEFVWIKLKQLSIFYYNLHTVSSRNSASNTEIH